MSKKDKVPTLNHYWPVLTAKDKALIMRALNDWRASVPINEQHYPEIHFGLLPFVSMTKVGFVLRWAYDNVAGRRIWAGLLTKVEASRWHWHQDDGNATGTMSMYLVEAKVHKHFGPHPERGVICPVVPSKWMRGPLEWNIGAKEWRPSKIIARPRISLKKQGLYGLYEVSLPLRYQQLIEIWLRDHCT